MQIYEIFPTHANLFFVHNTFSASLLPFSLRRSISPMLHPLPRTPTPTTTHHFCYQSKSPFYPFLQDSRNTRQHTTPSQNTTIILSTTFYTNRKSPRPRSIVSPLSSGTTSAFLHTFSILSPLFLHSFSFYTQRTSRRLAEICY